MIITKAEAVALNLWKEIKETLDIKEGTNEDFMASLIKLNPHSSFPESIKLWVAFSPNTKFDLSPGQVLILCKKLQERDNLSK